MVSVGHVTAVSLQKKFDWKRATKTGLTPHVHPLKGFGEGTVPSVKKQHFLPAGPRPLILQIFYFEAKKFVFKHLQDVFIMKNAKKLSKNSTFSASKWIAFGKHKIMILKVFSLIKNIFFNIFFSFLPFELEEWERKKSKGRFRWSQF